MKIPVILDHYLESTEQYYDPHKIDYNKEFDFVIGKRNERERKMKAKYLKALDRACDKKSVEESITHAPFILDGCVYAIDAYVLVRVEGFKLCDQSGGMFAIPDKTLSSYTSNEDVLEQDFTIKLPAINKDSLNGFLEQGRLKPESDPVKMKPTQMMKALNVFKAFGIETIQICQDEDRMYFKGNDCRRNFYITAAIMKAR